MFHLPPVDWQGSKWPSQIAVSTIVTWRWTGYNALIYLAGMQSIDYVALRSRRDRRRRRAGSSSSTSRCPACGPTILFTIVVSTIGATQLFGEPLLYDPTGQPNGGSSNQYQTLGLLMYQQGWTNDRLGLASATAWTMFVIIIVAVLDQPADRSPPRARRAAVHRRGLDAAAPGVVVMTAGRSTRLAWSARLSASPSAR